MRLSSGIFEMMLANFSFGIGKGVEPIAVKRSHDFGRNHRIHTNSIWQQFCGPLARESHNCAFGRCISGRAALPRNSGLRANVHDAAARTFQMRQRVVRHRVVVHKVTLQRGYIFVRIALLKPDFVIAARVVDQAIQTAKILHNLRRPNAHNSLASKARR